MTATVTPDKKPLSPETCTPFLKPFDSWPSEGGLPAGYFSSPCSSEVASFYRREGFLVIVDALSPIEIETLKTEATRLCRNEGGDISGVDPAPEGACDDDVLNRILCIHFPHKLSSVFQGSLSHPAIRDTLTSVIGPNVKCMQSMLFLKASGKPGQAWHQDEDFIPTRDRSLTGAWIALDDATVENGCLWVLPRSHAPGILWPQKFHFDTRFDCTRESYAYPWKDEDSVPVEVKAGSIVFFNGYLLHRSLPNRASHGFRRSLVNHYMSAESLLPWMPPDERTGMALADYRDIVMIAGEDPYAFKGTEDIAKAFVRSDGKGGCADWNDEEQKRKAREHSA